jgi:4-amino-4-deoxy-L-arabinose transferase-like glycosyltransferase
MKTAVSWSGSTRWLVPIVGMAVALRIGAALYLGASDFEMPGIADQLSYHALAVRVLEGHGFSFGSDWWPATPADQPTAHWSYLYVLFLAGVYGVVGPAPLAARVIQAIVVGVLQPLLVYSIGTRLFGTRVGLASAALAGCYGYFVYYAGALMTESFFIVAVLWSLDLALRIGAEREPASPVGAGTWLQLGLALGAAVLLRQAVLFVSPIILGWAAWRALRHVRSGVRDLVAPVAGVALAVCMMIALIVPWTVRNQLAFKQFVLLNTNAGFAFYWGNHPVHGTDFVPILPEGTYGRLIPDDLRGVNEAALDRALLARGLSTVAADPVRFLKLSASRLKEFVRFWPSSDSKTFENVARLASSGVCLPLFLFGILLIVKRRFRSIAGPRQAAGALLLLAFAGTYSMLHMVTWTLVRYRLPVDAVLMPFGALALVWVYGQARAAVHVEPIRRLVDVRRT